MSAMLRGDFEAAWRVCDRVLASRRGVDCTHWPRHLQYIWDGARLEDRRVLVRCYHGLGDTIQFVRLLPALRARARHVTLWVQPALVGLFRHIQGADVLLPLHDGAPECEYDVDIELMELPHALRLRCEDLPGPIPYICMAPPPRPAGPKRRVGFAWRGGDWDTLRYPPSEALERLAEVPDVEWFSLQYPPETPPFAMNDLACGDLEALARRMLTLDLVISVDTMTAHLAGALGLPVWTLLQAESDWRWMRERTDSPWYPTMRLFRQPRAGDWDSALALVAQELGIISRKKAQEAQKREIKIRSD